MRYLIAVLLLASAAPLAAQDAKLVERAALSRLRGNPEAPVTVFEFADFQCPFCARFSREVFPRLDAEYVRTGKVQWIFVNLPLPNHPNAWAAAEAAMCAGAVNERFWYMHDLLFARQDEWSGVPDPAALMARYAQESGVPADGFQACVLGDRTAGLLVRDVMYAANQRVTGTPAFVVQGSPIFVGMKTYDEWKEILEGALRKPAR